MVSSTLEMPPAAAAAIAEVNKENQTLRDAAEAILMRASLERRAEFTPDEDLVLARLGWDEKTVNDELRRCGRVVRALQQCHGPTELARREARLREAGAALKKRLPQIDQELARLQSEKLTLETERAAASTAVDAGVASRNICLESAPPTIRHQYNARLRAIRGRHSRCLVLENEISWRRGVVRIGEGMSVTKRLNAREVHLAARRANGDTDVPTPPPSDDYRVANFVSDAAWQAYVQRRLREADELQAEYESLRPELDRELDEVEEMLRYYWKDPAPQAAPATKTDDRNVSGGATSSATAPPGGIVAPSRRTPSSTKEK